MVRESYGSCIVVAACNAAIDTRQAVYAKRRAKAKQKQSKTKERRINMKKFISIWSILAMVSASVAIDLNDAIHHNDSMTEEQVFGACFIIAFFAIFALVCVGAHIESIYNSSNK